ncbi:cytosine/adenosine deaminase [Thermanaerovibrio velox DSM 12556]|uniref:tRNA-specific adenosine deaminase n=1 Tax=Thermanaerovibrio velox DSM 12556 TaxID=926567 RepID=H0US94_9BACT|nr:nucleoside deaminase [Thermanaerovibrio velox]EHM10183.1 cytosine/adenosine deaminase [Thermanaerovibrio velox DSM 12556]
MEEALSEARAAFEAGDVPVGAVIVVAGRVVGRGRNVREVDQDPLGHAEMVAIRDACSRLGRWRLDGASIYVTLEPCVMCAGAILQSRIGEVHFSLRDPKAGACGSLYDVLRDPRQPLRCRVFEGEKAEESRRLLWAFFKSRRGVRAGQSAEG